MIGRRHFLVIVLILSLGVVTLLLPLSSRNPDGLETVMSGLGLAQDSIGDQEISGPPGHKREILLGVTGVLMFALPSALWLCIRERENGKRKM